MTGPRFHLNTPEVVAASFANVAVTSVAGQLRAEHIDDLLRAFVPHQRQWGAASVSLSLVRGRISLPDGRTRARLQQMHTDGATADIAVVVIGGEGFWAAAARGVLASIALASRRAPHAAGTLGEALAWAEARLPEGAPKVVHHEADIARFWATHLETVKAQGT